MDELAGLSEEAREALILTVIGLQRTSRKVKVNLPDALRAVLTRFEKTVAIPSAIGLGSLIMP
jgi:hypothetical protein